jgi:hypothetical protein
VGLIGLLNMVGNSHQGKNDTFNRQSKDAGSFFSPSTRPMKTLDLEESDNVLLGALVKTSTNYTDSIKSL